MDVTDRWRVVQSISGHWQIVCPKCGNRGGNYKTREFAEHIAELSATVHELTNHR